jgi:hypothetical protein
MELGRGVYEASPAKQTEIVRDVIFFESSERFLNSI